MISIYYSAKRATPLTVDEKRRIEEIEREFAVEEQIESYLETGEGLNWESFIIYDAPNEKGAIFEGATKLPDNSEDAIWTGVEHWCKALTALKLALPGAIWAVHVNDQEILWSERTMSFHPLNEAK